MLLYSFIFLFFHGYVSALGTKKDEASTSSFSFLKLEFLFCSFSKDGKGTKRSSPIGMQPHRPIPLANRHGHRTRHHSSTSTWLSIEDALPLVTPDVAQRNLGGSTTSSPSPRGTQGTCSDDDTLLPRNARTFIQMSSYFTSPLVSLPSQTIQHDSNN